MNAVNLYVLTRVRNEKLYTAYENKLSGKPERTGVKKHEFKNLISLVECLISHGAGVRELEGFYYGYTIGQIGKEFDLLKMAPGKKVLNIELKSQAVPKERIEKQLLKNSYYLSSAAPVLKLFTYVEENQAFYTLENNRLVQTSASELIHSLRLFRKFETWDIDRFFSAGDYLISPLDEPQRFAESRYFLTQQQESIKNDIISAGTGFFGVTGDAGTGKTLLLYDLAAYFSVSEHKKCCVIHIGTLTDGHKKLARVSRAFDIVGGLMLSPSQLAGYECFFVDEAQRISMESLKAVLAASRLKKGLCVFSYDRFQTLSKTEQRMDIPSVLSRLPGYSEYTLSGRIRCNREISSFIRVMLDLNNSSRIKNYSGKTEVLYASDESEAANILRYYCSARGFVYIALEESEQEKYLRSVCRRSYYTEEVIGREFNKVIITIDDRFYYDAAGRLRGRNHPNPDFLYDRLFFQAVSRTREYLSVVIIGNDDVFAGLLNAKKG